MDANHTSQATILARKGDRHIQCQMSRKRIWRKGHKEGAHSKKRSPSQRPATGATSLAPVAGPERKRKTDADGRRKSGRATELWAHDGCNFSRTRCRPGPAVDGGDLAATRTPRSTAQPLGRRRRGPRSDTHPAVDRAVAGPSTTGPSQRHGLHARPAVDRAVAGPSTARALAATRSPHMPRCRPHGRWSVDGEGPRSNHGRKRKADADGRRKPGRAAELRAHDGCNFSRARCRPGTKTQDARRRAEEARRGS